MKLTNISPLDPKIKFVCLCLDNASRQRMLEYCAANNIPTNKDFKGEKEDSFDFHITVIYTKNEVRYPESDIEIPKFPVEFMGVDMFGENKNIPVLKVIPSLDLMRIRRKFEILGFQDEWGEDWKPHVSLSYNYSGDSINLKLPPFKIYVDRLIVKDQN